VQLFLLSGNYQNAQSLACVLHCPFSTLDKKAKHIHKKETILMPKRMLLKDYDYKGSVTKKEKSLVLILKGLGAKTN
jgi:hypothetical protein